ncbi:uncharacterized protein LY89DRAFT_352338 [Mollisia scopiformis]|uniref:Uncharacterized protein n=1 Tax=Mollisia scopiformis TaxID=149040 RepID=A0A132B5Y5_MOLSC|nr:uncharacterized protein LY89DRAFT_352338 [Mollisia scopiformis]KUJ07751.1 hypothetical protein LY89DRAFT_352338 [Mollisia scopiformis]
MWEVEGALIVQAISKIVKSTLTKFYPEMNHPIFRWQWVKSAAATYGDPDQIWHTSIQVNVSAIGADQVQAIKGKGKAHIDRNDMPYALSLILFLSHAPENFYHGRFVSYGVKAACECAPYGSLLLMSKLPHGCTGYGYYDPELPQQMRYNYPPGLIIPVVPKEYGFGRIVAVSYGRNTCYKSNINIPNPDLLTDAALPVLGSYRAMYEYRIRYQMTKRDKDDTTTAEEWSEKFSWMENGRKETPKMEIATIALEENPVYEKMMTAMKEMFLDAGCGMMMPGDGPKPKTGRRGGLLGEVKIRCHRINVNKKQCAIPLYVRRWGNTFCKRHQG